VASTNWRRVPWIFSPIIIANNSTAAFQFDNPTDASETLSTISIERHIVAAALYDTNGALFARWPVGAGTAWLNPSMLRNAISEL
jgi:hypothetical protein